MGVTRRNVVVALGVVGGVAAAALSVPPVRRLFHPLVLRVRGTYSVEQRVAQFSASRARLEEHFRHAGVAFPPTRAVLLGLKDERRLEVYAAAADSYRRVTSYAVLAASGTLGPKLREGDRQVPEGVYGVASLNPNSRFHVSLRVDYPNAFDRETAAREGRDRLGGDIMIHGGAASVGCLAMGDPAAEELFLLAATVGIANVTVVLSPVDLRTRPLPAGLGDGWRAEVYRNIRARLDHLPS